MKKSAQQLQYTLRQQLGSVLFGMETLIDGLAIALTANGHVLLEGAPGLGKTLLAKSLARVLGNDFGRIQCTADLMPSDMTGMHVFDVTKNQFDLHPGPLFNQVVLVDEINRTGPKTQSALLQAMEENMITLDRKTYTLPQGFFVIASQNPQEYEGVYPLIESQLDRFLIRLQMHYPDQQTEIAILKRYDQPGGGHSAALETIVALPEGLISQAQEEAADVHVADSLYVYVAEIAAVSRDHAHVSLGLSSRGTLALMRCAKVRAAMQQRDFVTPDDVKNVATMVAGHRILLTSEAMLEGVMTQDVFQEIVSQIAVPRELENA